MKASDTFGRAPYSSTYFGPHVRGGTYLWYLFLVSRHRLVGPWRSHSIYAMLSKDDGGVPIIIGLTSRITAPPKRLITEQQGT